MFYAASGMNVSQVGADAEHLPSRAEALTSLAWSLFLFASQIKEREKGLCFAIAKLLCLRLWEMETSGLLIY